jgi:hypothetical protein
MHPIDQTLRPLGAHAAHRFRPFPTA